MFEDSIGFLWIGTNSGLYRYDGNNLIEYQNNVFDPYSIPNNSINSITEDENQNLWMGSESFLICYNRKLNQFKGFYKNITSFVLYKASDGTIWANLRNMGLVHIEPNEEFDKIDLDSYFNYNDNQDILKFDKQINTFVEDSFSRYWVGTKNGIFLLNSDNTFVEANFKEEVVALKLTENNKLIALTKRGLYILGYNKGNNELEILEAYPDVVPVQEKENALTALVQNATDEDIWLGTMNGLIKAKRGSNAYEFIYPTKDSPKGNLANNEISSLLSDTYNNLWIGTVKGINKHISRTSLFDFHNANRSSVIIKNSDNNSLSLVTVNDKILLGSNTGLYSYNFKENNYNKIQIVSDNEISTIGALVQNYEKTKLFISSGDTLYQSKGFGFDSSKIYLEKLKVYDKLITDVQQLNKNETWVALWDGGVDIINSKGPLSDFKKSVKQRLTRSHTSTFLLTRDHNLWVGTRGEGLFKIDLNNEVLEEYSPSQDGLSSNAILCLLEDSKSNIWIGTRGGGLNLYDKKENRFRNFNDSRGMVPKTVAAIEEDDDGHIWMSTQEGITSFDVQKEKFIPFGIEDGIQEIDFFYSSSTVNKVKNELYFGNANGFYTVFTDKFLQKNIVPATVITNFSVLSESKNNRENTEVNISNALRANMDEPIFLSYNQNNILVNFSSLDLTTPNKNEYAYKLEGLNDYWVYTTASNRNANYNNLSPGSYTFMVKSSNSDGIWNETPTELKFTISPPFWKSAPAYLLYILLLGALAFLAYHLIKRWYRLKKNLVKETISREKDNEHNRMKMIFFTDISHELRTPLSLILGTIEKIVKEKKFGLSPHTAQRIYNNTLRMHRLINQIMDVRKFDEEKFKLSISKNDIVKDIDTIKNAFNDFARIYGIQYDFSRDKDKIEGWYDVDILEKTLFNLLSNAFKFTKEKGAISVTLDSVGMTDANSKLLNLKKNIYIKCSVRDNGMGIPEKDLPYIFDRYYQATKPYSNQIPGTGIGMELVHKLIERHHGIITVESEENKFTEFTFYLPINKNRYTKKERLKTGTPLKRNFIHNSEFQVIEEVSTEFETKQNSKINSKPKILIVEDNEDLSYMIKEELKSDFQVIEACDGKEGFALTLSERPLLIISDILMPVEDGISMLRRIKDTDEINNIPIFMLTAKSSEDTKIECLSIGADDYIEKPFSLEFVKWKIKNALEARKELKEKYSRVISPQPSEIQVTSNDEKFIKKLIKIIEDSMNDNLLSVEYLASEVGMSRANLYRKLQVIINDTPVNFIKKIKLKRAAQLLKKNTMYISEIAYMTGFSNQKYFGKCFQKEYTMSPTEYIKKHAVKQDKDIMVAKLLDIES